MIMFINENKCRILIWPEILAGNYSVRIVNTTLFSSLTPKGLFINADPKYITINLFLRLYKNVIMLIYVAWRFVNIMIFEREGPENLGQNQNLLPEYIYIFMFKSSQKSGPVGPPTPKLGVIWKFRGPVSPGSVF